MLWMRGLTAVLIHCSGADMWQVLYVMYPSAHVMPVCWVDPQQYIMQRTADVVCMANAEIHHPQAWHTADLNYNRPIQEGRVTWLWLPVS